MSNCSCTRTRGHVRPNNPLASNTTKTTTKQCYSWMRMKRGETMATHRFWGLYVQGECPCVREEAMRGAHCCTSWATSTRPDAEVVMEVCCPAITRKRETLSSAIKFLTRRRDGWPWFISPHTISTLSWSSWAASVCSCDPNNIQQRHFSRKWPENLAFFPQVLHRAFCSITLQFHISWQNSFCNKTRLKSKF